jgi:hypothetical protein
VTDAALEVKLRLEIMGMRTVDDLASATTEFVAVYRVCGAQQKHPERADDNQ